MNLSALGSISPILSNGWQRDTDAWLYSTAYVFYIAGKDVTSRFPRGTKIKLTQTTEKFWYVDYSTYTGWNTGVALAINADYTLANATITSPYYSYASNPQGFPAAFNHVDSWDGFSTDPTGGCCNYSVEGGMVTLNVYRATAGTADANNCAINLPLTARNVSGYATFSMGISIKTSTVAMGFAHVAQNASSATLYHAPGTAPTDWNTSGDKNWTGQIRYHL